MRSAKRAGRMAVLTLLLTFGLVPGAQDAAASDIECVLANPDCVLVTVTMTGNGAARWQSSDDQDVPDGKINCYRTGGVQTGVCSWSYYVSPLTFTRELRSRMTADPGSDVCSLGECYGGISFGYYTMTNGADLPITQNVVLENALLLTVSKSGLGSGTVTSTPVGIRCGTICSLQFALLTEVTLSRVAASGSVFAGWSGDCSGTAPTCTVTMSAARSVGAVFQPTPVATKTPTPTAVATKTPTPVATARPTLRPTTPGGGVTPTSTAPSATAEASSGTGAPSGLESPTAPSDPAVSGAITSPVPTADPALPVDRAADMTPIAIAIVIAAGLLGAGLLGAAYLFRRRLPDRPGD